jgi:hypothetical protein
MENGQVAAMEFMGKHNQPIGTLPANAATLRAVIEILKEARRQAVNDEWNDEMSWQQGRQSMAVDIIDLLPEVEE